MVDLPKNVSSHKVLGIIIQSKVPAAILNFRTSSKKCRDFCEGPGGWN